LKHRELDDLEWSARAFAPDDLGFVEPVYGLGERVVVTVADVADGQGIQLRAVL